MKAVKYIGITLFVIIILIIGFAKVKRISPVSMVNQDALNIGVFSNVVMNGYDAVSYHMNDKPLPGKDEIYWKWKGGTWLFSSEENKHIFEENPNQYAPLFGGYCAYAISKGITANTNPKIYEIIDGKLILFASEDVHIEWMKNPLSNLENCTWRWND